MVLFLDIVPAESENRLEQRLKAFNRNKLLIIDEIGYINLDEDSANLFFQLISMRYESKSTIITTNKNLSKWPDIFCDSVKANAILDRLLHHSHIVNIIGPSYRTKDVWMINFTKIGEKIYAQNGKKIIDTIIING